MTEEQLDRAAIKRISGHVRDECERLTADGRRLQADELKKAWKLIVAAIEVPGSGAPS